ncbi:uncharacterized protein ACOB8E_013832 [Sarcophilus harrisii]
MCRVLLPITQEKAREPHLPRDRLPIPRRIAGEQHPGARASPSSSPFSGRTPPSAPWPLPPPAGLTRPGAGPGYGGAAEQRPPASYLPLGSGRPISPLPTRRHGALPRGRPPVRAGCCPDPARRGRNGLRALAGGSAARFGGNAAKPSPAPPRRPAEGRSANYPPRRPGKQ